MDSENRAYLCNILNTIYKNICFVWVEVMSQGDITSKHTKHMFGRKNCFGDFVYSYVYLSIIRTFDSSK